MEAAALRRVAGFTRYGSGRKTQVYVYGRLDTAPTAVPADVGFSWNLGGYLLTPFLERVGPAVQARMQRPVPRGRPARSSTSRRSAEASGAAGTRRCRQRRPRESGA